MASETFATEYPSIEALIRAEAGQACRSVHVECARETSLRARQAVAEIQGARRGAI